MTEPTTPDLAAIRAREAAATKGPWGYFAVDDYADVAADYQRTGRGSYSCRQHVARLETENVFDAHDDWDDDRAAEQTRADAAFMAHAHEDVPALLAEVDRLRARVAELEATTGDSIVCPACGMDNEYCALCGSKFV